MALHRPPADRTTNLIIIDRVLTLLEDQTKRASQIDNLAINEKLDKLLIDVAELTGWVERLNGELNKNG
jgi:hypothetical protein